MSKVWPDMVLHNIHFIHLTEIVASKRCKGRFIFIEKSMKSIGLFPANVHLPYQYSLCMMLCR